MSQTVGSWRHVVEIWCIRAREENHELSRKPHAKRRCVSREKKTTSRNPRAKCQFIRKKKPRVENPVPIMYEIARKTAVAYSRPNINDNMRKPRIDADSAKKR